MPEPIPASGGRLVSRESSSLLARLPTPFPAALLGCIGNLPIRPSFRHWPTFGGSSSFRHAQRLQKPIRLRLTSGCGCFPSSFASGPSFASHRSGLSSAALCCDGDSLPIGISVASPIAKDFQNSESAPFSLANRQPKHRQKPPEQVAREIPMPIREPAQGRLLQSSKPRKLAD